jgi:enterochelin esterase-like enzyme
MSESFPIKVFRKNKINSSKLSRDVIYDIIVPQDINYSKKYKWLLMNDGQDYDQLEIESIIINHLKTGGEPIIFVGVHTNENRLREYGTAEIPDYKGRGDLATQYSDFIINEFMPNLKEKFPLSQNPDDIAFCGFSLGGLSAIDIVWQHPQVFSTVGVFSGSFWWRNKSYEEGYFEDLDRIMHQKIKNSEFKKNLRFWFECGTKDETEDRNQNGIIDSIEDTLDLINELLNKGYTTKNIKYVEVLDGEHNFFTWKKVFPEFISWWLNN